MQTLFSLNKTVVFTSLFIIFLIGCRKEIDYSQISGNSNGAINTGQPILEAYEAVNTPNINDIRKIESDGNYLYFAGLNGGTRRLFKMDSQGNITTFYNVNAPNSCVGFETCLTYQNSTMYACFNGLTTATIVAFDSTGVLQTYDVDLELFCSRKINALIDLDTSFIVAGKFNASSATGNPASDNVAIVNKTTGVSYPLNGIDREIYDMTYFNNELYVSGYALTGTWGWPPSDGWAVMKWTGSSWTGVGYSNNIATSNYNVMPTATGLGVVNNRLFICGNLKQGMVELVNGNFNGLDFWNKADPPATVLAGLEVHNNELYLFGDVTPLWTSFLTVTRLHNGTWQKVGALEGSASDIAVMNDTVYAVLNGSILKYPLIP